MISLQRVINDLDLMNTYCNTTNSMTLWSEPNGQMNIGMLSGDFTTFICYQLSTPSNMQSVDISHSHHSQPTYFIFNHAEWKTEIKKTMEIVHFNDKWNLPVEFKLIEDHQLKNHRFNTVIHLNNTSVFIVSLTIQPKTDDFLVVNSMCRTPSDQSYIEWTCETNDLLCKLGGVLQDKIHYIDICFDRKDIQIISYSKKDNQCLLKITLCDENVIRTFYKNTIGMEQCETILPTLTECCLSLDPSRLKLCLNMIMYSTRQTISDPSMPLPSTISLHNIALRFQATRPLEIESDRFIIYLAPFEHEESE